jgi:hypothetical protein
MFGQLYTKPVCPYHWERLDLMDACRKDFLLDFTVRNILSAMEL